jgi:transcriptional regulator with XRE-family HTH domain
MKSYGRVVYDARKAKGWTLQDVARRSGTHKGYISGIESRKVAPPSPKLSNKLAKALGLDPLDLLRRAWVEKAPAPIRTEVTNLLFPGEKDD